MVVKRVSLAATGVMGLLAAACQTMPMADSSGTTVAQSGGSSVGNGATVETASVSAESYDGVAAAAGYPANAQPGECFARVLIPEVTQVMTESVVDQPEYTETLVVPAVYDMVSEQVLVREAQTVLEVVPATYRTVTEQVMVEEAINESRVIPATYESYSEQVLVRPAYASWKPGEGLFGRSAADATGNSALPTGEILCRVEVPAEYETVSRRRLVTAERVETNTLPARYETISREVIDTPAQTVERVIPAEYRTVSVRRLVQPAREEAVVHAASFRTVERTEVVGGGTLQWREVLCETNATPQMISSIQGALRDRNYYSGPVDGVFGMGTLTSMEAFQRDNGLIVGQLTRQTVEALDLPFQPIYRPDA